MTALVTRVRRSIVAAGLTTEDLIVTNGGDRVRLVCSQGYERALAYAGDVLTLSGFTVQPGIEPWYLTITTVITKES